MKKLTKNTECLHLMNTLIPIKKEITGCNYDILFYNNGFIDSIYKKIPRFIVDIPDTNKSSFVFIIGKFVFSFNKKLKKEVDFVRRYRNLFIKSWKNEYIYGSVLDIIIKGIVSGKTIHDAEIDSMDEYKLIEDYSDITNISKKYNINHNIILHDYKIQIQYNINLINIEIIDKKIKYNRLFKNKIESEINFIKKYIDVFDYCINNDYILFIHEIIDMINNGYSLETTIKELDL